MSLPSQRNFDFKHAENIERYSFAVKKAYLNAIKKVSKLTYKLSFNDNDEFYFRNNPEVSKAVDEVLKTMYSEIYGTISEGANTQWDLAAEKNNLITNYVFGDKIENVSDKVKAKYLTTNEASKKAFVSRKTDGLGLSDRVWKQTRQFKQELELGLQLGIGKGKSADQLSRSIRQFLNEPDKLFRRVKDENGILRLSKAAKLYKPGQGVYRSSYKNAQRLTRNEINFSYEESQRVKREQQEFIVGIKIMVSPSHNPDDDKGGVCCSCLQGMYPKNFNFTNKWHTNCKCYSISILKTREELDKDVDQILNGEEPSSKSVNKVGDKPKHYYTYIKENEDKWKNWKNKPRFLEKN